MPLKMSWRKIFKDHSHAKPYPGSWQIPRLSWAYPKWIFYDTILEQVDHNHAKTLSLIMADCSDATDNELEKYI